MTATIGLFVLVCVLVLWLCRPAWSEPNTSRFGWGGGRRTSSAASPVDSWSPSAGSCGGWDGCSGGDGGGSCG